MSILALGAIRVRLQSRIRALTAASRKSDLGADYCSYMRARREEAELLLSEIDLVMLEHEQEILKGQQPARPVAKLSITY